MSRLRISVVIPVFNRAELLSRALESVLRQSHPAWEIIVVDDGSTDDIRLSVRRHYPGVRLLRQANRGVSAARNMGTAAARGEWIAFLDSDDEWHPEKLATQAAALAAQPDYRICHSDEIWIRRGVRVNPMDKHAKRGGFVFADCLPLCVISPSSVVLERRLLIDSGGFDEALPACEDYDLWLRLCSHHPVLFVPRKLVVKYGGHADQLSRRYWGMDRFRVRALEKVLGSSHLSHDDRLAAMAVLVDKLSILVQGARKRDNTNVLREFAPKLGHYEGQLARLRATRKDEPLPGSARAGKPAEDVRHPLVERAIMCRRNELL